MNCEEARRLADGYLDGELDPITSQAIEEHLRGCRACEEIYEAERALTRAIATSIPYEKASSELRHRIQTSLQNEIGAETQPPITQSYQAPRPVVSGIPWNWLAIAAAILLTAIITWNLSSRTPQRNTDQFLATQLIASHVRSLMANHLTDIPSSDQHTVKPWLDEKLDFAVSVADFATDGFPLVGGRLDYLDHRPVAALVYQRRKHFINLFIWLAEPGTKENAETMSRQGYQLLHWTDSDFSYWAVSDVNSNDLQTFRQLFEKQTIRH